MDALVSRMVPRQIYRRFFCAKTLHVDRERFRTEQDVCVPEWKERYIEKSKLPTRHFLQSLPRLRVPNLQDTMLRYLAAQKPLLSEEEFQRTEKLAKDFATKGSDGWELNQRLLDIDQQNPHTSYIAEFWSSKFLRNRSPLTLTNFYLGVDNDPRQPDQVTRSVNFINSAVRFHNSVIDNVLEPDIVYRKHMRISPKILQGILSYTPKKFASQLAHLAGAIPLDVSQYYSVYGGTRIPQQIQDEFVSHSSSRHIIVMRKGHLYPVEVKQSNGYPVKREVLYAVLSAINSDTAPPPPYPVNYLTGIARDTWADARRQFMDIPENARALSIVESALFIACLDDNEPKTPEETMHQFQHNKGYNRWFDKSIELVFSQGAQAGVNGVHSSGGSAVIAMLMDKIAKDALNQSHLPPSVVPNVPLPEKLQFNLTDNLKRAIKQAREQTEEHLKSLVLTFTPYDRYGKAFLKKQGLSPISVFQLAVQLAYHRLHGHFPATMHPCTTAAFLHGALEWARPGTMAAMACAKAFLSSSSSSDIEKKELLKKAVSHYSSLTKQATQGQGFDRHLYALKCLAQQQKIEVPFFEDKAYIKINDIELMPSGNGHSKFGCYCPYNDSMKGYGIPFYTSEDHFGIFSSSFYDTNTVSTFIATIFTVLDEIYSVCLSSMK